MADGIHSLSEFDEPVTLWDDIVNASPEGWFWCTRATYDYRITCLKTSGRLVADLSFVFTRDGRACGLAPLVIVRDPQTGFLVASYGDAPLPWPMVISGIADRQNIERILFDELERRVVAAKAVFLQLHLATPSLAPDVAAQFAHVVRERSFVDISYQAHWVEINPDTLRNVRERYRRYVRKFWGKYEIVVYSGDEIAVDFAQTYKILHVKDAGRDFRPLSTYEKQIESARRGEGFCVVARHKATDRIVGALLISLHKGAAYDASVAVDPEFQHEPVSNLMKWKTVQHLLDLGVSYYELGYAAFAPSYLSQPSEKNYGITFFKEGWSRGRTKTVWAAEKFYVREAFDQFWSEKRLAVMKHFFGPTDMRAVFNLDDDELFDLDLKAEIAGILGCSPESINENSGRGTHPSWTSESHHLVLEMLDSKFGISMGPTERVTCSTYSSICERVLGPAGIIE